jgi:hypothetical protein
LAKLDMTQLFLPFQISTATRPAGPLQAPATLGFA